MVDIHKYHRRLERSFVRVQEAAIPEANRKALLDFSRFCMADGISAGKLHRYLDDILSLTKNNKKEYLAYTRDDIETIIIKLEQSDYSEWTKYTFKVALRKFFKWFRGGDEPPEEVRWIKLKTKQCKTKLPEELVTEEEVKKMISVADKPRDRALLAALYESGCRIYELLTIRMKHVTFDKYGATISVSGKTGSRRVRLVFAVGYLQDWLNKHPYNQDTESFVWLKGANSHDLVGYARVRDILQELADRANIRKKVNPHNFRHSRASFLASHLTESQLKEVFGWTQASRMASVYVHLSGKNTDAAILKVYGKVVEEEVKGGVLVPKTCLRCKTENETTNKFCKLCGIPLDTETQRELISKEVQQVEASKIMNTLLQDQEVMALLQKKMLERMQPQAS